MDRHELKSLILADYHREDIGGKNKVHLLRFLICLFWKESFEVTFWFRICSYLMHSKKNIFKILSYPVRLIYKHKQHKTGIQLPPLTNIKGGLEFFHYGTIIIAQSANIGKNASIHQGVTIGRIFAGKYAGIPTIGNNVVIFSGAKILGNVVIGDNAVVTKDVPANSVVAGIPAKVISVDSSRCFDEEWTKRFGLFLDII